MARPTSGYRNAEGKRVPGVTTITSRFKESGGLIHWAWNEGMEGRDYRETRDAAADAGTIAHDAIFAHLHGQLYDWPESMHDMEDAKYRLAYAGFQEYLKWERQTKIEIIAAEEPIVSETLQVGGTPDGIGTSEGEYGLLDWKTSNGLYADYLYQCGIYCEMVEEHYGFKIGRLHILRLGKEDASFHHHSWARDSEKVVKAIEAFHMMRELYEIDKQVKRGL